ncbi:uncharacterized protein Dyak_GE14728, partial [Drosophila yakuba]
TEEKEDLQINLTATGKCTKRGDRNAEEVAQRIDIAQQEREGYHVEAHKFMTNISDRLQQEFDGTNTPQQLGIRLAQFFEVYDQMEVRYQESSLLVDQLTQSKAQLVQQVAELPEDVATKRLYLKPRRVNAKLSEDNSVSQTARLDMSETSLKTDNELKRRINRVVHLEASDRRMTNELSACKREMNELKKELKSSEERIYMMKELLEALEAGHSSSSVFEIYDQESSLLVDQLTQSKAQLEQQDDVASKQVFNQETSSLVEQPTQSKAQLEQQVAALQKEVASQQAANQHSGPMTKHLNDSIQNLERVNAKLSEDNFVSQTARLDMSETSLKTDIELKRRINRVVHLEASEKRMTNDSNQKIAQLENALSEVHRNAEEMAQRLDIAQQEREGYHVEANKFMTNISDRLQQKFDGTNTPQHLGIRLAVFEMYDQMEVRYQESSLLVDQLTQSKAQLEQQVAELQDDVASKQVSNQETSSLVEQLTQSKAQLEQQVAALQKEVASQQVANQHSGPMIKQLIDSIQNLEGSTQSSARTTLYQQELYSSNQKIAQLENGLSEVHRNAEEMAQRLDIAQQEREGYHVEANKFMTNISDRFQQEFDGTNTSQQLGIRLAVFEMYDEMEVRYQESSLLVDQLTQSKAQLEQQVAELPEDVARQLQFADALKEDLNNLQPKNEELVLNTIQGVKKRESIVASLEIKSEKLNDTLTSLEQELYSSNQKIAQLENGLSEVHRNAEEMAQRLDIAQQEREGYHVEANKFMTNISDRFQQEFDGTNTSQQLGIRLAVFEMYDEMEVRYQESSLLVDQLTQSKAQLEQQVAELPEDVAIKLEPPSPTTDSSTDELLIIQAELQRKKELTADLKEQLDNKTEENKSLQSQLQEQGLVVQLKANLDMKQMLSKVRDELESCSNKLAEAHVRANEELLCLQAKQAKNRKVGSLKVELKNKEGDVDGVQTARVLKEFEENLATLKDQIETLEERHTQTEAERATPYERINMFEARCHEKDETIRTMQGQIERVEHVQHELQSEMGSHNVLVEQPNRELAGRASELLDVQNRLETAIAELNQANEQLAHISELQHRLEAETAERIHAQKRLAEVTDRLNEVVQDLDSTRIEHGAQKVKMEERAREAEQNNGEFTESLEFYKQRLNTLKRLLAACNEELADLNSGRAKLTEATPDLGATYSDTILAPRLKPAKSSWIRRRGTTSWC